ncbi:MAG: TerC family protein, partial [Burkholderiaceae bacterium]
MIELLSDPHTWIAFATLTALELVLGIDNVIFISILVDKLPAHQRELARKIGLFAAMFMRVGLLFMLSWIIGMTSPLFDVMGQGFSGRDLVLLLGGLFLLWKSVGEIHHMLEGAHTERTSPAHAVFGMVIL